MYKGAKKTIYNSSGTVLRTQDVFTGEAVQEDIRECRKENGLPELMMGVRCCLRCGTGFNSDGAHNRICFYCKVDFRTIPNSLNDYVFKDYRSILRRTLESRRR